jgi:hypothetical protein
MFRGKTCEKMNLEFFGVGSTIEKKYVVVNHGPDCQSENVGILNLTTMKMLKGTARVEDVNHISKAEFVKILGLITELPYKEWAVSDFTACAHGIKLGSKIWAKNSKG